MRVKAKNKLTLYFDNAAAMPIGTAARRFFASSCRRHFVNQEAGHTLGHELRAELKKAESELGELLGADRGSFGVQWTGSGTEAINLITACPEFIGRSVVCSAGEHPALTRAAARTGPTTYVKLRRDGRLDPDQLAAALGPDTALVAIHHVQSETGAIQNLSAIAAVLAARAPQTRFLVDAVQSAGKLVIPWAKAKPDFVVISGHKLGAPGGGALLYRQTDGSRTPFAAHLHALRHREHLLARPFPPQVLTLVSCLRDWVANRDRNAGKIVAINNFLRRKLTEVVLPKAGRIIFPIAAEQASPYILSFLVPGFQGAVLVRMLSAAGIAVAAGSACSAETKRPSPALGAMGFSAREAFSMLRLSFGPGNNPGEAKRFLTELTGVLKDY